VRDPTWPGKRILYLHTKRRAPSMEISTRNKFKHVNVTVIWILIVNGQEQLCQLAYRDLSNQTRQARFSKGGRGKGKKQRNADVKIPMKFFSHYPPTFPFILKAFPKTFPAKMNPASCKCPAKEKTRQDCCITVKLCFLSMPKLIRRPPSAGPVKGFVACFISLQPDSDQKTARLALKRVFQQNSQGRIG